MTKRKCSANRHCSGSSCHQKHTKCCGKKGTKVKGHSRWRGDRSLMMGKERSVPKCAHSLCTVCAENIMKRHAGKFICPICREEGTPSMASDLQWADGSVYRGHEVAGHPGEGVGGGGGGGSSAGLRVTG